MLFLRLDDGMYKIFLIDDDLDDREIFHSALMSIGRNDEYSEAFDGMDAFQKIGEGKISTPDIIFLDLNMPRMSGLEFLVKIRENPDYKEVPIYIYSTSSAKNDIDKCMTAGATGFVTKHHSYDELCTDLRKLLGNR